MLNFDLMMEWIKIACDIKVAGWHTCKYYNVIEICPKKKDQ